MKTNILITGQRNIGKSTLVKKILQDINQSYCGFITVPYEHYDIGSTYIMKDLTTHETKRISCFDGEKICGVPQTFSTLGASCLKRCLTSEHYLVVMDELGRFERNNDDFIQCVNDILSSDKNVIAVLKDEDIEYLQKIKAREDVYVYHLNHLSLKEAYESIIFKLKRTGGQDETI